MHAGQRDTLRTQKQGYVNSCTAACIHNSMASPNTIKSQKDLQSGVLMPFEQQAFPDILRKSVVCENSRELTN
jgi:hypothetical protein